MPSDQPPADPFRLLGLARSFDLDAAALQRIWLARSAALHPDRPGAPPDAAEQLAAVNEARAALLDPEQRANALLALLGGPSREQDKSLPDGFLVDMLETREQMESEIAAEGDAARRRWREWAGARRDGHVARVRDLFRAADPPPADALREIRRELNAWRYIERMIEQT